MQLVTNQRQRRLAEGRRRERARARWLAAIVADHWSSEPHRDPDELRRQYADHADWLVTNYHGRVDWPRLATTAATARSYARLTARLSAIDAIADVTSGRRTSWSAYLRAAASAALGITPGSDPWNSLDVDAVHPTHERTNQRSKTQ